MRLFTHDEKKFPVIFPVIGKMQHPQHTHQPPGIYHVWCATSRTKAGPVHEGTSAIAVELCSSGHKCTLVVRYKSFDALIRKIVLQVEAFPRRSQIEFFEWNGF
jgi:hypothetical protein